MRIIRMAALLVGVALIPGGVAVALIPLLTRVPDDEVLLSALNSREGPGGGVLSTGGRVYELAFNEDFGIRPNGRVYSRALTLTATEKATGEQHVYRRTKSWDENSKLEKLVVETP